MLPLLLALVPQLTPGAYDAQGDPLGSRVGGTYSAGDVWSTVRHGQVDTDGVAPHPDGLLVACGLGQAFLVDEDDGSLLDAYPLEEAGDNWLAWDGARGLVVTANASSDTIKGYTPGHPVPLFAIASPTPGPVGLAWDSRRDEYALCDWITDQVVVLDAAGLQVVRVLHLPLTRMAGVAYDCLADVYVIGDRDSRAHHLVHPESGALLGSFPTAGQGMSVPRGAALSPRSGGVWTGEWASDLLLELDPGRAPAPVACVGGLGTPYCTSVPSSTGLPARIAAAGSASLAADHLLLSAEPVPVQPGLFLHGPEALLLPFGDGFRCVGGTVVRLGPAGPPAGPRAELALAPLASGFAPGQTVRFQYWFRDPAAGGSGYNLSDGLELTWLP